MAGSEGNDQLQHDSTPRINHTTIKHGTYCLYSPQYGVSMCLLLEAVDPLNVGDKRSAYYHSLQQKWCACLLSGAINWTGLIRIWGGRGGTGVTLTGLREWDGRCEMRLKLARPQQFGEGCGVLAESAEVRGNGRRRASCRCPSEGMCSDQPGTGLTGARLMPEIVSRS